MVVSSSSVSVSLTLSLSLSFPLFLYSLSFSPLSIATSNSHNLKQQDARFIRKAAEQISKGIFTPPSRSEGSRPGCPLFNTTVTHYSGSRFQPITRSHTQYMALSRPNLHPAGRSRPGGPRQCRAGTSRLILGLSLSVGLPQIASSSRIRSAGELSVFCATWCGRYAEKLSVSCARPLREVSVTGRRSVPVCKHAWCGEKKPSRFIQLYPSSFNEN